ncbi:MAG: hypothetical protein BGO43_02075 [Gammaproteobacteria bacterium 39-13]|jgi:hypothetical protein|nr:hypothetical protein [Gammaproteobacteria bacterium]OJV87339.1 MAG: hypothetical protein BGO43_02075 [Gammaproteobacteria bacterium 39-13]
MSNAIDGIKRAVAGYSKFANESGTHNIEVDYELKPIKLSLLQEWFDVDPEDEDVAARYLINSIEINEEQAKALQPYVIDGVIDLDKYDFRLECYTDE